MRKSEIAGLDIGDVSPEELAMSAHSSPIRFSGSPRRLEAIMPVGTAKKAPKEARPKAIVELARDGGGSDVTTSERPRFPARVLASVRPLGLTGMARVWFRLPMETPPGRYRGEVVIGDQRQEIAIDVESLPLFEIVPEFLLLSVSPSGKTEVAVTIYNLGNDALRLEIANGFGIYDTEAGEEAFRQAYLADVEKVGRERIHILMDGLAQGHGGLVRVRCKGERIVAVPVGASLDLQATFQFSDRLRSGRTYLGTWELSDFGCPVEVHAK